jgi:chromosome segregation ATPase
VGDQVTMGDLQREIGELKATARVTAETSMRDRTELLQGHQRIESRIGETLDAVHDLATRMSVLSSDHKSHQQKTDEHDQRIRDLENARLTASATLSTTRMVGGWLWAVIAGIAAVVAFVIHEFLGYIRP